MFKPRVSYILLQIGKRSAFYFDSGTPRQAHCAIHCDSVQLIRMGFLFNKVDRSDLRAGDHVYSWRAAYTYAHHGIYVGDNHVVHFTRGSDQELAVRASLIDSFASSSIPKQHLSCTSPTGNCGLQNGNNGVIRSCLDCFLEGGAVHRFEYGVSVAVFLVQARGGTCTLAQSNPPETVIHRSEYLLQNGFANYDVVSMNCEDFAIYCKTGFIVGSHDSGSGQVAVLRAVMGAVMGAGYCFASKYACRVLFAAEPVGGACWTVLNFAIGRYKRDIGVRVDKIEVPVESLAVCFDSSIGSTPPVAGSSIYRDRSSINGTESLNSATPMDRSSINDTESLISATPMDRSSINGTESLNSATPMDRSSINGTESLNSATPMDRSSINDTESLISATPMDRSSINGTESLNSATPMDRSSINGTESLNSATPMDRSSINDTESLNSATPMDRSSINGTESLNNMMVYT